MDYATRTARALLGATAHPGGRALSRLVLDAAGVGPGDRVLDVACGDGATLRLAARRGADAVGVDVEPRAVARTRGRGVVGDAHRLPVRDGRIDVVLLECALSTFARPGAALDEIARVLRPGGRLALTDVVLDRGAAPPEVVAAVDALTGARTCAGYAALLEGAGLPVRATADRSADALALVRRVRRRLALVSPRHARTARACEQAVRDGSLGYALLVAERPEGPVPRLR